MALPANIQKAHERAAERLSAWIDAKLERDSAAMARMYLTSRNELMEKLRTIYATYLADDPSFVRARLAGALPAMDAVIDETMKDLAGKIYTLTRDKYTEMLATQGPKLTRAVGRFAKMKALAQRALRIAEIAPTAENVLNELNTSVVVGGTYVDRLFHITDKIKADVTREIRQGLFNKESFDDVRERVHKVFGVGRLKTPKTHIQGAMKIYKNEARRQWNLLMKAHGKKAEANLVWFAILDTETTPGCAARHGFLLDDLDDDTMPHHPNCRCTPMVVPEDFDLKGMQADGMAWLKAEGWTRKDAMFEESGFGKRTVRVFRETWERWPGLRLVTFDPMAEVALVTQGEAEQLKLGLDPVKGWVKGDPRETLERCLRETRLADPIVAVASTVRISGRPGRALTGLLEARTGRLLYRGRPEGPGDAYARVSLLASDQAGRVYAVKHPDYPHWTLPGGHVEDGEDPVKAAEREFGEETGKAVRVAKYLGEFTMHLSTGEVANNMLYVGQLTGAPYDGPVDQTEIADCKAVPVVDLDEKEREQVERLWWTEDKRRREEEEDIRESARTPVTHLTHTGQITAVGYRGPRQRVVLAAPHGDTDTGTGAIVDGLRMPLEVSTVIAQGFDPRQNKGKRLNINRPTEGTATDPNIGEDATAESASERAAEVYKTWCQAVWHAAGGRPKLYIEIHDNDLERTSDHLEVATVNVTARQAKAIKNSFLALDQSLGIKIEPLDELEWRGVVAKHIGIFKHVPVAVQVELPKKYCDQAAQGAHGAIEGLEDWLEDVIRILTNA